MLLKGRDGAIESTFWSPWWSWRVIGDNDEKQLGLWSKFFYFITLLSRGTNGIWTWSTHLTQRLIFVKSPVCNHLSVSRKKHSQLASCVGSMGFPFCQQEAQGSFYSTLIRQKSLTEKTLVCRYDNRLIQSWLMAMLSNIFKGVCMCVMEKNTEHSPDPGKAVITWLIGSRPFVWHFLYLCKSKFREAEGGNPSEALIETYTS